MTIGEFSSLTRLSVRMLRYYDTHGVLVPADVDSWSGYRRYSSYQLKDANDIRHLRDIGFGVSAISALLAARNTPAWFSAMEIQRETVLEEVRAAQARLALINRLVERETSMYITVEPRTVAAMTIVSLRDIIPTYADEHLLWKRMMPEITKQGIVPIGPCGVIEHNEEYTARDVDQEIFFPVQSGTVVTAPLTVHELPERECLVARLIGPYEGISQAYDLLSEKIAEDQILPLRDGTLASRTFTIYISTLDEVSPDELMTEIYIPLS